MCACCDCVNTTGPEKESSQNRTGGVSEGKAPFRNLGVRRILSVRTRWSRVKGRRGTIFGLRQIVAE
jgi:hypothetical protein